MATCSLTYGKTNGTQDALECRLLVPNKFLATMVDPSLGIEEREESISVERFIRFTGNGRTLICPSTTFEPWERPKF